MFPRPLSLIVYADENACRSKIESIIQKYRCYGEIELLNTIETLYGRIRQNSGRDMIVILWINAPHELEGMVRHADLLCDHQILLVLADRSTESTSLAHALYPRFISYNDGNLEDIDSVLERMLERKNNNRKTINRIINNFIKKGANHEQDRRAAPGG